MENKYLQAAQTGNNDFWRYLLVSSLIGFGFIIGGVCLAVIAFLVSGVIDLASLPAPALLAINMLPFLIALICLAAGIQFIHRRPLISLINPAGSFSWARFLLSASLWFGLSLASDGILWLLQRDNYVFVFEPEKFILWCIVAGLLLPIQCAAEELLFRGYFTQGMGLAGGFWLAWLVPALVFGMLHGANPEVGTYGAAVTLPLYIATGLLLGWITLRSESLEFALGLHVANNIYGAVLVTFPSSVLPAPALFRMQHYDALLALLIFFGVAVIYLVLLSVLGRGFFRSGLFGKPG